MNVAAKKPIVETVDITPELRRRPVPTPNYVQEKLAIQDLAKTMADHPSEVLPRLVQLAKEICGADSAGVSILDGDVFRWNSLVGVLSVFNGATTPRDFSPCGVCLDRTQPVLMQQPERIYDWIADANITVPEVLLVPLLVNGDQPLGTLWVVAPEGKQFHSGHARVMSELSVFTGIALQMIRQDKQIKDSLLAQETLTKEMSHRLKNLFAIADGLIRATARTSATKEEMTQAVLGRMGALSSAHALVRRSFNTNAVQVAKLGEVIESVLRPYTAPNVSGPSVELGERSTNGVALVFYELATNAAKYGALKTDGHVKVEWAVNGDDVVIDWRETGADVRAPEKTGFGTTLVAKSVAGQGGKIDYDWQPTGLNVKITLPLDDLKN